MGILVTGTSISTTNSTTEENNATHNFGMIVIGNQPTYQQARGVVTVTPSPFAVLVTPTSAQLKYSLASFNSFTPGTAATPTPSVSTQGRHAEFYTFNTYGLVVPTSSPWSVTSIVGNIQGGPTFVSYNNLSDHRLKENVTPVENGLDYIMPLRPRRFTWKEGFESVGFIAHEIQEDAPPILSEKIVTGEKDENDVYVNLYKNGELMLDEDGNPLKRLIPKGVECDVLSNEGVTWKVVEEIPRFQQVDLTGLVSPLVASVQQLKKMIDTQKNKIEVLKSKILSLEGAI